MNSKISMLVNPQKGNFAIIYKLWAWVIRTVVYCVTALNNIFIMRLYRFYGTCQIMPAFHIERLWVPGICPLMFVT